jgi:amino acid transporter
VSEKDKTVGFWSVVAIGIGGMVGGGIFAVLGLAVQLAHGGTPVAFLVAGLVALVTAYSYARLSVAFPSQGGTVEFINQGYGTGIFTGGMNILLWMSYVIMLSLYAYAFGSYGANFFPDAWHDAAKHLLISGVIVLLTLLNLAGSSLVGKAEEWVVGFKILILLVFIAAGLWTVEAAKIAPAQWTHTVPLIAGGMIIFLAYEGFELIANTAADVRDAATVLPRAFYTSVIFVILLYILVSGVTVGNLSVAKIVAAKDYALAESAKPFLGAAGFTLITVAALLSTGSAINATLYGTARVSFIIAKDGELPAQLERKIWKQPVEGLFITSALTLLAANFLDLSGISLMGSAGFLLIFAAVNGANFLLRKKTGGIPWLALLGVAACLGAFGALLWQQLSTAPSKLWFLAGMLAISFLGEFLYRQKTGRSIHPQIKN